MPSGIVQSFAVEIVQQDGVFGVPVAAGTWLRLSEKPRQGSLSSTRVPHQAFGAAISRTALGLAAFGYDFCSGPRIRTYTRDSFTGLDYADQRFYASTYGRFNTADPYMASGGAKEPGSWNRYSYVGGDPVNYNDRSGNNRAFVDQNSSSGGCGDYQYWYFQLISTDSFSNPCGGDGSGDFSMEVADAATQPTP